MKLIEAFNAYKDSGYGAGTSLKLHIAKIRRFKQIYGELELEQSFRVENLSWFIFESDQNNCLNKYNALYNFYQYVNQEIWHKKKFRFPIDRDDVIEEDKKRLYNSPGRRPVIYLPRNFDLSQLLDIKFYKELKSNEAIIAARCAIALALSAGYDSGELFSNNSVARMKIGDCTINQDNVVVKNFFDKSIVPSVTIRGLSAELIKEFYYVRKESQIKDRDRDIFLAQIWKAKDLKYNIDIEKTKPYTPQLLVLYILKYISQKLNLPDCLTVTDLKSNMVLHALYKSRGAALQEIIQICGWQGFIQEAFNEYCEDQTYDEYSLDPFFHSASSVIEHEKDKTTDEATNKTRISIITSKIRDRAKVIDLKNIYRDTCQICGQTILLDETIRYSEVHHIQPHGGNHNGADEQYNMMVLCPNHHALLDLGVIALDPEDLEMVLHINPNNSLNNSKLKKSLHNLSVTCVRYHYENIFIPLLNSRS